MIDAFIELMKEVNISQIFIIFAGMWFFYNRLDKKLEDKFDKLSENVEDIDRRLCRIEGSLSTHGHCLFNQSKNDQKIV